MADFVLYLTVDLPDVEENPQVVLVSCGNTSAEVKEHGAAGSGNWAAWHGSHIISGGGTVGYPYEQAITDAREYVRNEEKRWLLHAALRNRLDQEVAGG